MEWFKPRAKVRFMKNISWRNVVILLLLVLVAGWFGWGANYYTDYKHADWETYTDSEYGFEIRYPVTASVGNPQSESSLDIAKIRIDRKPDDYVDLETYASKKEEEAKQHIDLNKAEFPQNTKASVDLKRVPVGNVYGHAVTTAWITKEYTTNVVSVFVDSEDALVVINYQYDDAFASSVPSEFVVKEQEKYNLIQEVIGTFKI